MRARNKKPPKDLESDEGRIRWVSHLLKIISHLLQLATSPTRLVICLSKWIHSHQNKIKEIHQMGMLLIDVRLSR